MHILYFTAWYPHRYDAMSGLFVRKHAEAVVAAGAEVSVFYLMEDKHIQQAEWVEHTTNGVRELYYYYPVKNRVQGYLQFWQGFLQGYERIVRQWGKPDVTQINVLTKNSLCAYYLYKKYNIPYVVVEHWSGYLPQNGNYKGFFHKRMCEHIVREAQCVMPISQVLQENMLRHGLQNANYQLLNNVVDDFFYTPFDKQEHARFRFLHVSCFDEAAKNTCGILRATAALYKQRQDFELIMVGTGQDIALAQETADALGLCAPDSFVVHFTGEQTPEEVAAWMRQADCFVLFSNYENAPVVLSESLAIGLPIITSEVGFVPQVINADNGRIVQPKDEKGLTEMMSWMIDHAKTFNRERIRQDGWAYSYKSVGRKLITVYQHIIS